MLYVHYDSDGFNVGVYVLMGYSECVCVWQGWEGHIKALLIC